MTQRLFGQHAAPTTRLDRYLVSTRLGSGANGVVYRAWDPMLRRHVALKLLRRAVEVAESGSGRRALIDESRRCARLEHPNVGAIYSVGHAAELDAWFIVMELFPGPTLREWAATSTPSINALCGIFAAVARGLDTAHDHGVIHGDFKPDNVMFGSDDVPRVVDFGGHGTPRYTAPEVLAGKPPTARADIYAFAVTVAELWSERPMPKRLERALRLARADDPERRPSSAAAIVRAMKSTRPRTWATALALALPVAALVALNVPERDTCEVVPLHTSAALPERAAHAASTFTDAWNGTRATYCETPSEDTLRCLEQTRVRWDRVNALASRAKDDAQTEHVVASLPTPAQCLEEPKRNPSPLSASFLKLQVDIHVTQDLGLWHERAPELRRRLEEFRDLAAQLNDDSVAALATLHLGIRDLGRGALDIAKHNFEAAYLLATRTNDSATAFFAATNLVRMSTMFRQDIPEGQRWLDAAEHASKLRDNPEAQGDMFVARADFALETGDLRGAVALYEAAADAYDDDARLDAWTEVYCGLGKAKRNLGDTESALAAFEAGLDTIASRQHHGRDTLVHACLLNGIGTTARVLGQLDRAAAALERLHTLMLRELPESPDVFAVLGNLAQLDADMGNHDRALDRFRAVHDAFLPLVGLESPVISQTRYAIGEQLFALGRYEDARIEANAALRWSAPEPAASGARLLVAKLDARAGEMASARARVDLLLADPALPQEVRDAAEAFDATLNSG